MFNRSHFVQRLQSFVRRLFASRRDDPSPMPASGLEPLEPRLLLSVDLAPAGSGLPGPPDAGPGGPEQSYVVSLSPEANANRVADNLDARPSFAVETTYRHALNGFAYQGPALDPSSPLIETIEPDFALEASAQTLPTGVDRIEADRNDTANIDGSDERVAKDIAVLDTGIDKGHPDLDVQTGRNFSNGPSWKWDDGNGHGTHVAGTAAALDNSEGVVGMAPGADLWAAKVLNDDGSGSLSDVIDGVDWVTKNADEIDVANMSLGASDTWSSTLRDAIANSVDAGVVYAVAAGNDSVDIYGGDGSIGDGNEVVPAAYPEVATISAMADSDGEPGGNGSDTSYGSDDSFASFTNYSESVVSTNPVDSPGAAIDLLQPGVEIRSTWKDGEYATKSGTSMASPHAAGLAALHMAANGLDPTSASGVHDVRQSLIDGGVAQDSSEGLATLDDPDANWENIGWAASGAPTVDITSPNDGDTVSDDVTIKADASDPDGSVTQVEFFVDSESIATDTNGSDGWSTVWDSTSVSDGDHSITAEATDDDSKTSTDTIGVTVENVDNAPVVGWHNPSDGETVSDTVTVQIDADDYRDSGSDLTVKWQIDDGTWMTASYNSETGFYEDTWDTTTESDGDYNLDAKATDTGSNTSSEERITVTVDNSGSSSEKMYVWDMIWEEQAHGPWTDLLVTVDVNKDVDGDGAESGDDPAANVTTDFSLKLDSDDDDRFDDDSWSATADTNSNGQVTFELKKAPAGDYKGEVTDLTHDTLTWDSSLDNENPDYYYNFPSGSETQSSVVSGGTSGTSTGGNRLGPPGLRDLDRVDALAAASSRTSPARAWDHIEAVLHDDGSEDESERFDILKTVGRTR